MVYVVSKEKKPFGVMDISLVVLEMSVKKQFKGILKVKVKERLTSTNLKV